MSVCGSSASKRSASAFVNSVAEIESSPTDMSGAFVATVVPRISESVLEMVYDAAPAKRARAACLHLTSEHKIRIHGRMQHLGAHLSDLRVKGTELHIERLLS